MKLRKYKLIGIMLFIFSLITPIFYTNVYASSGFYLSNGKSAPDILYAGYSYTLRVKGQSVYFYSSKPGLVEIGKKTGKLLVKEPGSVTIKALKRGSSRLICKKTFTIRRRSDYIVPSRKSLTLVMGQTHKLSVRKSPRNSTDVIRYYSSNTKVAKVDSCTGKITALTIGTASIYACSKADIKTSNQDSSNRKVHIPVKVYSSLTSAKQITLNEVQVGFSQLPSSLKRTDFSIKDQNGHPITVSNIATQGNQAILGINQSLSDGKVYTVTYKTSKYNFSASDGIIRKFEFMSTKVPINTETPVVAYAFDNKGIQLGEYEYGITYPNITFTVSSSYLNSSKKLNFTVPNGTALARISCKSSNTITADSGNVTISAYDPEMVSAQYRCTITNTTDYTFTDDSICKTLLPNNATDYYAHFNVQTSSKKEITDYSKYTFSSANTSILILQDNSISNSVKYIGLYPVSIGSTYIYMKDSSGYTVATFPVTVTKPSELTSIALSKSMIPLVNTPDSSSETITVTAKDQYNNTINDTSAVSCFLECTSAPTNFVSAAEVNSNSSVYYTCSYPTITFHNVGIAPGTYTYKVYAGSKYTTVTVVVSGIAPSPSPRS
ncbi:Ig-like domain-containing protein [[Clostridium] polysaccharolyticum]|uniref:Ig-like domain (Group 2) n=1 Tax=[Clostridium] polysaccharolyticum TaxID=29364 RepID=A0A1I0ESD3_9FIRM|nr:Ig-like domain-containing protein [[Clostridium] polysaccharolyticum]SET48247.1 Ig-like domain (group 2) [[Clostridium] polysaccharolyticum]